MYKFDCKKCPSSYIGEAKRALNLRLDDHITNKNPKSVVPLQKINGHDFDWDNAKILDKEPTHSKCLISEIIHINCTENTLNIKDDSRSLQNQQNLYSYFQLY